MIDRRFFHKADEVSRRQFMLQSAKTFLGVSAAPMLGATLASPSYAASKVRPRAAKSVIFLNMNGGMSHLDTFDPKPGKSEVMGPVSAINTTADGIQISEYLPKTAQAMHHVALIRSMQTNQGAHEQGQYILHRSYAPRGTIVHPALGAWVMRLAGRRNTSIPGFVSISGSQENASAGFMGAKYSGVPIGDPGEGLKDSSLPHSLSKGDFDKRLSIADKMNQQFHTTFNQKQISAYEGLYDEAVRLMESEDLKAFDINQEDGSSAEIYGSGRFARGCLLARRLVEHQVRFVEVSLGGWDTHYDNFTAVEARCQELDQALAGLILDLERRGMLEDTLVALGTEFGRTPEIQTSQANGRDHHPAGFTCLFAGGGVKGGTVYGKTDHIGKKVAEDKVTPQNFNATIAYALGLPLERVVFSPSQRPFTVADKADPITSIFA